MTAGVIQTVTIAAGVITISQSNIQVDTEASASTDNLDTINGGTEGQIIIVHSQSGSRDPTLTESGNLKLAGTFLLSDSQDMIVLMKLGSNWIEISRSDNA